MQELSINELLDSVGINQSILAKIMQVSRSTITRMKDIATPEVIEAIDKYKADMTSDQSESVPIPVVAPKPVSDPPSNVLDVTHKNIVLSRIKYGREGVDIKDVANLFNLSVFDYNQAVHNTVIHCQDTGTSFKELRA